MEFSVVSRLEHDVLVVEVTAPEADENTRYAYYLYERTRGIVKKQMYIKESTFSFPLSEPGAYFVKAFVRNWPNGPHGEHRTTSKNTNNIIRYPIKIVSYAAMESEDFLSDGGSIYDIVWDRVHYKFFVYYKPDSSQSVIFGTGNIGQHPDPYFARITWAHELPCTAIYYSDPTSYKPPCTLGWGYGTNDRWYLKDIAALLEKILAKLGIPVSNTLFYGSSGGGFTSIMLAAMLRSRATVINPQFILENFDPKFVTHLKQVCLKEGEHLLPERTHVSTFFEQEGYFPPLHIIQNIRAEHDLRTQISPFLEELSALPMDCTELLRMEFYSHEDGHNGMPQTALCLRQISEDLAVPLPNTSKGLYCDFDNCGLPKPKNFFWAQEVQPRAKDIMDGMLWVHRNLDPMPYSLETLDFNVQWGRIPTTFQLYLQALTPVHVLTGAYEKTLDPAYLDYAQKLIRSWVAYSSDPAKTAKNKFVYGDHAVALRGENLMYFGQVCSKAGILSDELRGYLSHLLKQHGDWLNDDSHYTKRHNHGIMQDQALLHLGFVLGRRDWVEHAKERLLLQEQWAFNAEMVHTENSPGYADIVADMFQSIGAFLSHNQDPMGEKLQDDMAKTREFGLWARKPNGMVAQVGDTGNTPGQLYAAPDKMRRHTPEEHKIYPLAGYYFYRSNRGDMPQQDTWKLLKSGYVQTVHKHADDCSFMLYAKGYEIFVDGGLYGYVKDAFRSYFLSAKAHNTVVVDDSSYPCHIDQKDSVGMSGYFFGKEYDHVRVFNNAYEGVGFQRDFFSVDDMTILLDTLRSNRKHTYSQLFHLGEHMEVLLSSNQEVVVRLADSGYIVRIHQYGDPIRLHVIRGNISKPGYGLISRGTNHLDVITTLKFDLSGKNGVFATAITIEDPDGFLRLGEIKACSRDLRFHADTKTFTLGSLTIPCHDMPSKDTVSDGSSSQTSAKPASGSKRTLSIYGSCVSRDILTIANDTKFDLKAYVARQSVISAVAPKIPDGTIPLQNSSAFQLRMVESDLRKDAFEILKANQSDYLLLDFIDERFPLLSLFGSHITASSEFYESAPKKYRSVTKLEKSLRDGLLYLGDDCVEAAVKEFCTKLREIYAPEQIIVHCALMVDQYRSSSGQLKPFDPAKIHANHRINAVMETMYSRIQSYLPGVHVIREVDGMAADENHKWGLAAMHYQPEYYARVLARLYEITGLSGS